MSEPIYNGLTAKQLELLELVGEECIEVLKVLQKIKRFGFQAIDPHTRITYDNRRDLETEIGHVFNAVDLLCKTGDIRPQLIHTAKIEKQDTVYDYLRHQDE